MNRVTNEPHLYQAPAQLLQDKVVLVTGAGAGIGKAAALRYAQLGATVLLLGKTAEKLDAVYDQIEQSGGPQPVIIPVDLKVATQADYQNLASQIEHTFGHLDGLLLNAAMLGTLSPIEFYPHNLFEDVMKVNVNAQFHLIRSLMPLLRQATSASIILTSSSVGRQGRANWGAYAISKFAVEGMMQTLADELGQATNIRVNCINPGATRTSMRASAYPAEDPAKLCLPEDILPLYAFLMGEDSRHCNGQTLDAQPKN